MLVFIDNSCARCARQYAPWALIFAKHRNGYMAFLSKKDFLYWKRKLKKFYKKEYKNVL